MQARLIPLLLLSQLLFNAGKALSQAKLPRSVRIEVSVRDSSGNPLVLRGNQFRVSGQAAPSASTLPVSVIGGQSRRLTTHVLLVLPQFPSQDRRALEKDLEPLWAAGWSVGVLIPEVWSSEYVTTFAALVQNTQLNPASSQASFTVSEALDHLHRLQGRKVVVFLPSTRPALGDPRFVASVSAWADLYEAGSGDAWQQEHLTGYSPFVPPFNGNPANAMVGYNVAASAPNYQRVRGPIAFEGSLHAAFRDALEDAGGSYQIMVAAPQDCKELWLQVRSDDSVVSYRLQAEAYEDGRRPPTLTLVTK